jgi:hypothetical protein
MSIASRGQWFTQEKQQANSPRLRMRCFSTRAPADSAPAAK